ncbi:MAG: exo-alpha-sialidase [Lachnospiraceae bacterium]|nr:exo-alpha-sialidase [Lachnospiraceae bacterium]
MRKQKWKAVIYVVLGMLVLICSRSMVRASGAGDNVLTLDAEKTYLIYAVTDTEGNAVQERTSALYDDGGTVSWIKHGSYNGSDSFQWKFTPVEGRESTYYINSLASVNSRTPYPWSTEGKTLEGIMYLTGNPGEKGEYVFRVKDRSENKYTVSIQSLGNERYVQTYSTGYAILGENEQLWCIEEIPKPTTGSTLWTSQGAPDPYRIPAIAAANNGNLLAVSDYRYKNDQDLGIYQNTWPFGHRIDLVVKNSKNNGVNWSDSKNLTVDYSKEGTSSSDPAIGFGDAAIVADRDSDEVLLLSASGGNGYVSDQRIESSYMRSFDNGESFSAPENLQDKIYALNENWKGFFFTSGRIMQSRYIKTGQYYRIYSAILAREGDTSTNANYVVYSDDFGETWKVLGGTKASPVPGGDEAKIEELPGGSVLISSRTTGGRYYNIFDYADDEHQNEEYSAGTWGTKAKAQMGWGDGCNGEILIVYAKNKETNAYEYLALQSLPADDTQKGNLRRNVRIFYRTVSSDDSDPAEFAGGWTLDASYLVKEGWSGYSAMCVQKDGSLGVLYEDGYANWAYNISYLNYDLETITGGKYEMAFRGIGSAGVPYQVVTEEQARAVAGVYNDEGVHWQFTGEALQN